MTQDIEWGSLAVSEELGLEVIQESYGWAIALDGTVAGLTAGGDMGYEFTHITIPRDHIVALVEDWPEFNDVETLRRENQRFRDALREVDYFLQDDLHNRATPRAIDIAYTAFMLAKRPNEEDGEASDWCNDTLPTVRMGLEKIRKAIKDISGAIK